MKPKWTPGEKLLWATPLLLGVVTLGFTLGPEVASNLMRRASGQPQLLGTTPTNRLIAIALSHDGSTLAATGEDLAAFTNGSGTVYLWDARTLAPLKPLAARAWKEPDGDYRGFISNGLALSPDGKLIGLSDRSKSGYAVYDSTTQRELWRAPRSFRTAAFSPDGRFIVLSGLELREARTGKIIALWTGGGSSTDSPFRFSPDGKMIALIGRSTPRPQSTGDDTPKPPNGQSIEIWRVGDGKKLRTLDNSQETYSIAFSPDGTQVVSVATGSNNNSSDGSTVRCHSIDGEMLWQRDYRSSNPKRVGDGLFSDAVFSPDGRSIALRAVHRNEILLLDAANGHQTQQLTLVQEQYSSSMIAPALAFSSDSKRLFVRGSNSVVVWDIK